MQHPSTNRLRLLLACFWAVCLLVVPGTSRAGISLGFIPIEEAKFLVRGDGWENSAAIDLTVDYDTTYIFAPQVTVMGGALAEGAPLDATPGRLQLRILNETHSPNFEACIFFEKQGEYPVVINFVTAEATGPAGARQPVPVAMLANPNAPQPNPAAATDGEVASTRRTQTTLKGESQE